MVQQSLNIGVTCLLYVEAGKNKYYKKNEKRFLSSKFKYVDNLDLLISNKEV